MKLLYLGIRCDTKDKDGSAWNIHFANLLEVFNYKKYDVKFFKLNHVYKKNFSLFNLPFLLIRETFYRKRLIPFQELLYIQRCRVNRIDLISQEYLGNFNPDILFFEGIRTCFLIEDIKNFTSKNFKIICDMDDLLSYRYWNLFKNNDFISFGYETKSLRNFSKVINFIVFKQLFLIYEIIALSQTEKKLTELCDGISLINKKEKILLEKKKGKKSKSLINTTLSFDPFFSITNSYKFIKIERFIFIGSDRQIQNRTAIINLIKIWEDTKIHFNLHIYGKMFHKYNVSNKKVIFEGFVENLSDCYKENSVLINLTTIKGGIKIKTIEAISRGIPVIGYENAFGGIPDKINLFNLKNNKDVRNFLKTENINNLLLEQHKIQNKIGSAILSKEAIINNWEKLLN